MALFLYVNNFSLCSLIGCGESYRKLDDSLGIILLILHNALSYNIPRSIGRCVNETDGYYNSTDLYKSPCV